MPEKKEYPPIPEELDLLRVAERTPYSLAAEGQFPAATIGERWRISHAALDGWRQTVGAARLQAQTPGSGRW